MRETGDRTEKYVMLKNKFFKKQQVLGFWNNFEIWISSRKIQTEKGEEMVL